MTTPHVTGLSALFLGEYRRPSSVQGRWRKIQSLAAWVCVGGGFAKGTMQNLLGQNYFKRKAGEGGENEGGLVYIPVEERPLFHD
jgi:hypothetical protein